MEYVRLCIWIYYVFFNFEKKCLQWYYMEPAFYVDVMLENRVLNLMLVVVKILMSLNVSYLI